MEPKLSPFWELASAMSSPSSEDQLSRFLHLPILNTFLWWLWTACWNPNMPCSQAHRIDGEKEAQTHWQNTKAKAGLGLQPKLPIFLQLQSWLSWALSSVFGLDVRLGESALLASSFESKVSLRYVCCQISRVIGLSHNVSPHSPLSETMSHNVSCEGVGRTKAQTSISSVVSQSLLWWHGAWALNEGALSTVFPNSWGQRACTSQMMPYRPGCNTSSITNWLGGIDLISLSSQR